ncbi:hypothetical protein CHU92_07290 [Flavobacterium cyanobacteriorum]|uniref:Uncharacterized protein n=1 Tax=Flavobacterium cyanobacteriorum TaxID=2022802 RepID=A0A255ZB94_9FLAO|nr:hypothetical protein [Flavobacterium cyanobacteriorum]OYQ37880.1 hypothetical protein CHU92_07290 [Flavobacterium cyanobacteriorum]
MKFPNYLINSLAIVGALSIIIMACSADNSNSANVANSVGKYQISTTSNAGGFFVIDTETGVVKTFKQNTSNGDYILTNTTITQ